MSIKNELDQYYTKPEIAKYCVDIVKNRVKPDNRRTILEPSAGAGAFLGFFRNTIACDLEPKSENIKEIDFLITTPKILDLPPRRRTLVLGNPPFGFAASLAIQFFNHAAKMSNTIAFIVPRSFEKESVQNKLDLNFHLDYEEVLPKKSFILHDEEYDVPCVFQIWKRKTIKRKIVSHSTSDFTFIKKNEVDQSCFCIRRVGGRSGKVLNGLNHSESSTYFIKPKNKKVVEVLSNIDFSDIVNKTAGVRSLSKNELVKGYNDAKNRV